MNTLLVVVAVTIIVVAVLMLFSKLLNRIFRARPANRTVTASPRAAAPGNRWRAVRISPGLICCQSAQRLRERVFLAREAPRIPLDDCSETECQCRYVHLEDRRSGEDRRMDLGDLGAFLPASRSERRRGNARRAADLAA